MRVAVDATVVTANAKGAGRVVRNLLLALPEVDPAWRFVALATPDGARALRAAGVDVEIVPVGLASGAAWELRGMARLAASAGAEAALTLRELVGPGGPPVLLHVAEPPAYRVRTGLRRGPVRHVAKDVVLHATLRGSIRRAAAVTAASRTTAAWLRQRYGVDPPVIPPGVDPIFFTEPRPAGYERPYLLHPATGDPRDNTDLVLRAFAKARPADTLLVLSGVRSTERASLERRSRDLGTEGSVRLEGWVDDERLRDLYAGALALVHPTRYEGFAGLQPLEAMALGTPVIALEAPGVTEALAGAAELLPSEDEATLADAMTGLTSDDRRRAALGVAGRELARRHDWARAAERFVAVLRSLAGRGG